jgi:mycofactocin precursor
VSLTSTTYDTQCHINGHALIEQEVRIEMADDTVTVDDDAEVSSSDGDVAVSELLVEEVSIDGMCGVY